MIKKEAISKVIDRCTSYLAPAVVSIAFCSCAGGGHAENAGYYSSDTIQAPESITVLKESVSASDPSKFASIVLYPLERPYPLKDIADSAQMVTYYPILIDSPLQEAVRKSRKDDWHEAGWRGWTLHDGQYFWIDDLIYSVTYMSAAEKGMRSLLIRQDMETLPKNLRQGWTPAFCLVNIADGSLYRVDSTVDENDPEESEANASYRLLVYYPKTNLRGRPSKIYKGTLETQGSMGNRIYRFQSNDGSRAVYYRDFDEDTDSQKSFIYTAPDGKQSTRKVAPAYWLDYIVPEKQ